LYNPFSVVTQNKAEQPSFRGLVSLRYGTGPLRLVRTVIFFLGRPSPTL